jgi:arylsulfatase A-like enzyme
MKNSIERREFMRLAGIAALSILFPGISVTHPLMKAKDNSPNVLIFVFDALSARHLSLYGYIRETMPNLNRFAEGATVFHNHHTTANITTPATASLLTGTHVLKHRSFNLGQKTDESFVNRNIFSKFHENGYNTIAYTHNAKAEVLLRQFQGSLTTHKKREELLFNEVPFLPRMAQNDENAALQAYYQIISSGSRPGSSLFLSKFIEIFNDLQSTLDPDLLDRFPSGLPGIQGTNTFFLLEDAIDWIVTTFKQELAPTLGYFHMLPPHKPYSRPREYFNHFESDGYTPPYKPIHPFSNGKPKENLDASRTHYDQFLLYVDDEFDRLLGELEDLGIAENSWIIFTSDHGEMFERGWGGHSGLSLYHPLVHVPLIIKAPGQQSRKDVHEPTSHIDLLPTLEKVAGLPTTFITDGGILPSFENTPANVHRPVIAFNPKRSSSRGNLDAGLFSITRWPFKLIYYFGIDDITGGTSVELFNLEDDPEELEDLAKKEEGVAKDLLDLLKEHIEMHNK